MADINLVFQKDFWEKEIFWINDDQVATCHLLFSLLVKKLLKGVPREKQNFILVAYLYAAQKYLKDLLHTNEPANTSYDQTIASCSLIETFETLWKEPSKDRTFNKKLYLEAIKLIIKDYPEIAGEKTFKEYFVDITFNALGRINSEKAEALFAEYIDKVDADDFKSLNSARENDEDEYDVDEYGEDEYEQEDTPFNYCLESWDQVKELLKEIPLENAVLFHAIALQLCLKCNLEEDAYSKYQKYVIKAVSAYKKNLNERQIEFVLNSADEAFEKLKDRILLTVDSKYDNPFFEGDLSNYDPEIFILATDICLSEVSEYDLDMVEENLDALSLVKDSLSSEKIEGYCVQLCEQASIKLKEFLDEYNSDDTTEKDTTEEECIKDKCTPTNEKPEEEGGNGGNIEDASVINTSSNSKYYEKLAQLKENIVSMVEELDITRVLFFHTVCLEILVSKEMPRDFYSSYEDAITKAVNAYQGTGGKDYKEMSYRSVNKVFLEMLAKLLDIEDFSLDPIAFEIRVRNLFVIRAMIHSLTDIPSIDEESIESSLEELEYDYEIEAFYSLGTHAYSVKYKSLTSKEMILEMFDNLEKIENLKQS